MSHAIFSNTRPTPIAANGSRSAHLPPKSAPAPTPTVVAMEESASLRWCHAFANNASLSVCRATRTVA